MSAIPHADGPYGEVTGFGVYKATALELLRRTLERKELGWLTLLDDFRMKVINGEWILTGYFRTTKGWKYGVTITLELRPEAETKAFPVARGLVNIQGSVNPDLWTISERGDNIAYV